MPDQPPKHPRRTILPLRSVHRRIIHHPERNPDATNRVMAGVVMMPHLQRTIQGVSPDLRLSVVSVVQRTRRVGAINVGLIAIHRVVMINGGQSTRHRKAAIIAGKAISAHKMASSRVEIIRSQMINEGRSSRSRMVTIVIAMMEVVLSMSSRVESILDQMIDVGR